MSEYRFSGRERITIELEGSFEPTLPVPAGLALDLVDGRGRVSLFAFHVEDLTIVGMPLIRASYAELLWRVAVRRGDDHHRARVEARCDRAWWVVACDIGAAGPAWAARRWVRYPVRKRHVAVDDEGVRTDGLAFEVGPDGDRAIVEHRAVLTNDLFRVPWGDDASGAHRAEVRAMTDTVSRITVGGEVGWASTAIIRRGRQHRCGVATRL